LPVTFGPCQLSEQILTLADSTALCFDTSFSGFCLRACNLSSGTARAPCDLSASLARLTGATWRV